jgi:long-chain acyl-CoA synthetase
VVIANRHPKNNCLGHRPYDPVTKTFGAYEWQSYGTIQTRRRNFGAGLVRLHQQAGVHTQAQYGVGLWCQNRPEWQITGMCNL